MEVILLMSWSRIRRVAQQKQAGASG